MNLTAKKTAIVGLICIGVITFMIGVIGFTGLSRLKGEVMQIHDNYWPTAAAVADLVRVVNMKMKAHAYVLEGEYSSSAKAIAESDKIATESIQGLKSAKVLKAEDITTIENCLAALNNGVADLTSTAKSSGTANLVNSAAMNRFDTAFDSSLVFILALHNDIDKRVDAVIGSGEAFAGVMSSLMIVFVLAGLALIVVIGYFIVNTLNKVISKIVDAVTQITSSSNEILASTQQEAASAKEQSAAVAETTSSAKELLKSSESVGDSIKKVSQVAGHALTGMGKLRETIGKTSELITSLGEKSAQIGKIINLIDDVADQTNLLAVNASIEAARAGEQGRGFTVVADEIRKLADSTGKSTKDITGLIELIQHEMSNAIMSMESSIKNVEEESKLAQDSADRSKEIAMAATQQITGSKQISDAMANIDEAMKQIAAATSETQAAIKQLNNLSKELKELTELLK